MKTVFDIAKILLLSLIVVLLAVDAGLVDRSAWVRVTAWFERAGIVAIEPDSDEGASSAIASENQPAGQPDASLVPPSAVDESGATAAVDGAPADAVADRVDTDPLLDGESDGENDAGAAGADPADAGAQQSVAEDAASFAAMEMSSEHELKTLLQHRLASRYEFPEHVRFRNTHFTLRRLFHDAGLQASADREVEFAIYCGEYSVPNAAALYGVYRPFYAEVLVNHAERSMDGEYWLDIDGDIKKSISFRSDLLISARQETFDRLYGRHCGSKKGFLLGDYRDYSVGQLAPFYRRHYSEIADKASQPEYARNLMDCIQSKETLQECYRKLPVSTNDR